MIGYHRLVHPQAKARARQRPAPSQIMASRSRNHYRPELVEASFRNLFHTIKRRGRGLQATERCKRWELLLITRSEIRSQCLRISQKINRTCLRGEL